MLLLCRTHPREGRQQMLPEGHRSLARRMARMSKLRERERRVGLVLFLAVLLPAVALLSVTLLRDAISQRTTPERARVPRRADHRGRTDGPCARKRRRRGARPGPGGTLGRGAAGHRGRWWGLRRRG